MTDFIRTDHCNMRDNLLSIKPQIHRRKEPYQPQQQTLTVTTDEVDHRDYRMEEVRLQSYENWPVPYMDPGKMAAAGFYYTGEGDKVRCFECKVEICQWLEGDNPMADHQRWQEQCRFIRKIPCGNVPIGENPNSIPTPRPRSRDVCGPYGVEYRAQASADCPSSANTEYQSPSAAKLGTLGIGRQKGPAHGEYASRDARLRTFETWPKCMPQTKECLADAGFYYTGKGDQTLCYHCGGGLKDWEPNDDPWEQHAKWFSKCSYLLMVKGQTYVNTVTGLTMPPPSKEETMQMNLPSYIKKVQPRPAVETEKKEIETEKSSNAGASSSSSSTSSCSSSSISSCSSSSRASSTEVSSAASASAAAMVSEANSAAAKTVDDVRLCKICYGEELGVVFLPCGHIVTCVKCAPAMTNCALCRQPVSMTVRAFFS